MEYLVVDVNSRIIKIPETITHLGVKDDNETRTLKFQMAKVYKGLDLSDYTLEINFINANNKSDSALTENKQIDGDNITFEWCVGKSAYAKNGKVNFLVYAYLENEYGIKTNEWHTTWAKLDVLDGGNVYGAIAEENPQIIEEMLRRIKELENAEKDAVLCTEQELTEEQQEQARKNIRAADEETVSRLSEEIAVLTGGSLVEPKEDDIPKVFIDGEIPTSKTDVLAELTYVSKTDNFHAYLEIKCQGDSSLSYPKKNFTIKMFSDDARETKLKKEFKGWGEHNKFVLKANWIDHSHARNIVSAKLWGQIVDSRSNYASLPDGLKTSPNNGAIEGFPVKVYNNGTYQGIYTWNIPKDDWLYGVDEDNPNQFVLYGQHNTNGTYAETANNFRALWDGVSQSDGQWEVEVGTNSDIVKTALNNVISLCMNADDETFKNTLNNYLDVQSALDYYIFVYTICALDSLAQNMILVSYDGTKLYCSAYDLDSTFGLWWNGQSFVSTSYRCPEDYQEPYSLLWERIEKLYADELKARYAELRKTVLSYSNMVTHFERFMDVIGLDLYAEDLTIYTGIPSGSTNNITQIRNYIRDRLIYCDSEFETLGEGTDTPDETIPATGIVLSQTSLSIADGTPVVLTATVEPSDTTDTVVWESSNTEIAMVNGGVVTPVGNGSCTITAMAGSVSATCEVSVSGIDYTVIPLTSGILMDSSTGEFSSSANDLGTEEYIPIAEDYTAIEFLSNPDTIWHSIAFYDSNKNYLYGFKGFYKTKGKIFLKRNEAYMRFSVGEYTANTVKIKIHNDMNWSDDAIWKLDGATNILNPVNNSDAYVSSVIKIPENITKVTIKNINGASFTWKQIYAWDADYAYLGKCETNTGSDKGTTANSYLLKTTYPDMKYVRLIVYPNNVSTNNNPDNQIEIVFE